ncbi:sugar ABC transporter permease [Boudabousia liubingyangii]|nr:sugar ABC transporter permease [Boudabousia liubingyangii]
MRSTLNKKPDAEKLHFKKPIAAYLLILPAIVMVLVTLGYPLAKQIIMSFQKFGLEQQFGAPAEWVFFDNYKSILTNPYFWKVFGKSLLFCLVTASITMFIGIGLSLLLLRTAPWARRILNTTLVVVWAMPALASLTVWQWLIDPNFGLINWVLSSLGFKEMAHYNWLSGSVFTFYLVASIIIIWQSIPLVTISIYAALAQVSEDMLEASMLDGANSWQQIRHIMLPVISPVIALIGVLQIIWDLRVFTQIYVLQQSGGIQEETNLLGTYVYQTGISRGNYGMASALAMVILILTLVLTSHYLKMLFKQGEV